MRPLLPESLLKKYTSGTATPQEMEEVEQWYAASETDGSPLDTMSTAEKEALAARIRATITIPDESFHAPVTVLRPWTWAIRVAATVAIVLLAGWGAWKYTAREKQLTYTNSLKIPQRVTLTDSSVVWLHPGATLTVAPDFGENTRSLALQGIAFFQVKRDENRPFIIHTKDVFTQVLGTSFTIDATSLNSQVEVAVLSGKVRVQKEQSGDYVILLPAQKARYTPKQRALNVSLSPRNDVSAVWKAESIEFDNTSLREITRVLSKRFGVEIAVENADIYACQLTANFTDQNLPTMLEMIGKSLELTYELDGNKVVLTGKGCPP